MDHCKIKQLIVLTVIGVNVLFSRYDFDNDGIL